MIGDDEQFVALNWALKKASGLGRDCGSGDRK